MDHRIMVGYHVTLIILLLAVLLHFSLLVLATKNGFYAENLSPDYKILKLSCMAGMMTADNNVVSISIFNGTNNNKMAWVSKGREPSTGTISMDKKMFLAGGLANTGHYHLASLQILLMEYEAVMDQKFICNVTVLNKDAEIKFLSWTIAVNKTLFGTVETTTSSSPFTDAPYRIGAIKEKEADSSNLPMTVLIVMLVLISVLLFLAVFLLLHRYKSRCQNRDEELYRPPAYCMAPDHHLDWSGTNSSLKGKGFGHSINSRSHYSIAAHHMHLPLPPIPHSNVPRKGRTYRRPPSVVSSVKVPYVQPQDAIGQESSEDGEIAALSSGSPKVQYKSPRERPSRQNSPLYACVPVSSTDD